MNRQPRLFGSLVTAAPLDATDFAALYAVARDPELWAQHPANDRWQRDVFERFFADALASGGALLVRDAATDAVIGSSRYHDWIPERRDVEIGWTFLARSHWGGRYNGELKRLMLDHAFREAERVRFMIGPDNIRSQRAVERIGATFARRHEDMRGHVALEYAITRATWQARALSR